MSYYAVIDTNVVVSSMLKQKSIPWQILDFVDKGIIVPLLNEEIVNEYVDVITRNKFNFDDDIIQSTIDTLKKNAIFLEREQSVEDFLDKNDVVFFEIVMSARNTMDAYLVTGNIKHYPVRNYVVTPREMVEIIEKENGLIPQIDSK